jgi:hypothetical protein
MARPCKLTPEIQPKIGDNIALGLTYALAASAAGVTYQTLKDWLKRGQTEKSGKYFQFYKHIQKRNADTAKEYLNVLIKQLKLETARFACGYSNVVSVRTSET